MSSTAMKMTPPLMDAEDNRKNDKNEKTRHKGRKLMKDTFHLTFGEEIGNAVSHGVMMILLLISMPPLSVIAFMKAGWAGCIGVGIYLICMICMFGGSCLYHIMPYDTTWKTVFRKLDHISILLAIAGTYTPICLIMLAGPVGYAILALEWILAIIGIILKSVSRYSHPVVSMILYMLMGWMAIFVLPMVWNRVGPGFVGLIAGGGAFYTIGAFFYAKKKPYCHFVWHLMIAAAAIMHLSAIMIYL